MSPSTVDHQTFTLERTYDARPERVFAAWSDPAHKRRWFAEGAEHESLEYHLDFRVGGREVGRFRPRGGPVFLNESIYLDIVPGRRIVLAYTMEMDSRRFSASLATVEFLPEGERTRLRFTEQAAFFEGADGAKMRREGWTALFDALRLEVEAVRAAS